MAGTRTYGGRTAEQRAAERRARLIDAALAAFGTAGFAGTTIEALCASSGVTARHFYEHFASREELLLAVYEHVLTRHRAAIAAALDVPDSAGLEQRVRAAVGAALEAWTARPEDARVAFIEVVGLSSVVEAERLRAIATYVDFVRAIWDDLHARGLTPAPPRPLGARALVGALIALVEAWLTDSQPPATAEMIDEATRLALASLA